MFRQHSRSSSVLCVAAAVLVLAVVPCAGMRQASAGAGGANLLQTNVATGKTSPAGAPQLLPLRRESVPVRRKGKVVSFKTSYSAAIAVGNPAQDFRVVFDTGSAHVVLPAVECLSETCLLHQRYNMTASKTASAINADGSLVLAGELTDQVAIGFGTGEVTGEFVKELVCVGATDGSANAAGVLPNASGVEQWQSNMCVDMFVVMAVEMSTQPFKSFQFDGIVGLGLSSLALSEQFSFFDHVANTNWLPEPYFGFYLTEGDAAGEEESELALGGYNPTRALDAIAWVPVAMAELGYWQVEIRAVRVDGVQLDVCQDGTCRGIVDTGTSHWGIPSTHHNELEELLVRPAANGLEDCRGIQAPVVEIETSSLNLTLYAENYMRRMPLSEDVSVSPEVGVSFHQEDVELQTAGGGAKPKRNTTSEKGAAEVDDANMSTAETAGKRFCRPRIMPVRLPAPLGPKLFLLGEPVLHRYYTVFDWAERRVGFSLAANLRNTARRAQQAALAAVADGMSVTV